MKSLVVYYSRTGNTRTVALTISKMTGSDIEEIRDETDRSGISGYLKACFDALFSAKTRIRKIKNNPCGYDMVYVGTPVWAFNAVPSVLCFLEAYGREIKDISFFATQGSSGADKAFKGMEKKCRKKPKKTIAINESEIREGSYKCRLEGFISQTR
jgi:flavodoxin